jgi:anti-anti-sigma factor
MGAGHGELATFVLHYVQGVPVLHVSGEVDLSNATQFADALNAIGTARSTTIDLSDVPFMDSSALNVLAKFGARIMKAGGHVNLVVTKPGLRKLFAITCLDRQFSVAGSIDDTAAG